MPTPLPSSPTARRTRSSDLRNPAAAPQKSAGPEITQLPHLSLRHRGVRSIPTMTRVTCSRAVGARGRTARAQRLDSDRHRHGRLLGSAGQQSLRRRHRPGRRAVFLRPRQPADPAARSEDASHVHDRRQRPARATPATAGRAIDAALNMPHEIQFDRAGHLYIAERDNHAIRRVDGQNRHHLDAGRHRHCRVLRRRRAGLAGSSCASRTAIALDPEGRLLICDVGNHRVRRVDLATGGIETYAGTGERSPTADGAPLERHAAEWTADDGVSRQATLYLALREGNAIYRIAPARPRSTTWPALARRATPATAVLRAPPRSAAPRAWPAAAAGSTSPTPRTMRSAASISSSGRVTTVLGTGARGDGPEPDPLRCALSRPHGVFVDGARTSVRRRQRGAPHSRRRQ